MPISSINRSDPRIVCGLIAKTALARLESHEMGSAEEVYASTLVRLLDAYSVNQPDITPHPGIGDYQPFSTIEGDFGGAETQEKVHEAIDRTRNSSWPGMSRREFASRISNALLAVFSATTDRETKHVSPDQIDLLKEFLNRLSAELKAP